MNGKTCPIDLVSSGWKTQETAVEFRLVASL